MMDCFDDRFVMNVDMRDKCGYIVLDTNIRYNKNIRGIWQRFNCNVVKETNMWFDALVDLFVRRVKGKITMKNVNKMRTQSKFLVKQVK